MGVAARQSLWKESSILPNDYIELQYVNTNGDTTSYNENKVNSAAAINTGFIPTASTVLHTTICPGDNGIGQWETYMGGGTTGDVGGGAGLLRRLEAHNNLCFSVNAWS